MTLGESYNRWVMQNVCQPLATGLAAKGLAVTPQELFTMVDNTVAPPVLPAAGIPTLPVKVPKPKKTANVPAGQGCVYKFGEKSEHNGAFCGKVRDGPNSQFCWMHRGSAIAKKLEGDRPAQKGQPIMGVAASAGIVGAVVPDQGVELNVKIYDQAQGIYKEQNHGFLIYTAGTEADPQYITMGRLDANGTTYKLTDQQKAIAAGMNLLVQDDNASPLPAPSPKIIPQIPQPRMTPPVIPPAVVPPVVAPKPSPIVKPKPGIPTIPTISAIKKPLVPPQIPVIAPRTQPPPEPVVPEFSEEPDDEEEVDDE